MPRFRSAERRKARPREAVLAALGLGALVCLWTGAALRAAPSQARPGYAPDVERYVALKHEVVALEGVTLVDGSGGLPAYDQTILVVGSKIAAVGNRTSFEVPDSARRMPLKGRTVIPGLVGMHNHTHMPGQRFMRYSVPRLYLAGGVTTIQTAGSASPEEEIALARSIARGFEPGPRIFPTSPYVTGPGGSEAMFLPRTVAEARSFVDEWARSGATWIKLYRHIESGMAATVIAEAHRQGLKVTGHLCSLSFRDAAALGIDRIEHGLISATDFVPERRSGACVANLQSLVELELGDPRVTDLISLLVQKRVTLTSTLAITESHFPHRRQATERDLTTMTPSLVAAYRDRQSRLLEGAAHSRYQPDLLKKLMAFERAFVAAGGRLVAGPDTGRHVLPGYGDQRNFELLVEAGFEAHEAVRIMTANGARELGIGAEVGQIQTGMRADLVVLEGNLVKDPSAITRVELVFKEGTAFDPVKLVSDVRGQVGLR